MDPNDILPQKIARLIRPATDGSECWNWQGFTFQGYGRHTWKGHKTYVHRTVHELINGPIPQGHTVHHRCYNKSCCNPTHLEAITRSENARQGGLHGKHRRPLGPHAAQILGRNTHD